MTSDLPTDPTFEPPLEPALGPEPSEPDFGPDADEPEAFGHTALEPDEPAFRPMGQTWPAPAARPVGPADDLIVHRPQPASTAPVQAAQVAFAPPAPDPNTPDGQGQPAPQDQMRRVAGIGGIILLAVAGLLAVMMVLGGGGSVADQPGQVGGGVVRVPVRTASPSGDDPGRATPPRRTAGPEPTASAPPRALRGRAQVVEAMVRVMRDPEATARMTLSGTFRTDGVRSGMYGAFLVAGDAMRGRLTLTQGKQAVAIEMVYVNGLVYVRRDGAVGSWTSEYVPSGSGSGFGELRPSDLPKLRYDGVVEREGRRLHRFHLTDTRWKGLSRLYTDGSGATLKDVDMEVLVDDRGRIVTQSIDARMTLRVDGRTLPVSYALQFRYGRFGEPVDIGPPES
jgi:hypothetical protein